VRVRFCHDYPIAQISPAPYNPRRIDPPQFEALCESLRTLGFVKPVILNQDGTIVAGHQRTRAAASIGLATVPAAILPIMVGVATEAKFNLSHNKLEYARVGRITGPLPPAGTWGEVGPEQLPNLRGIPARLLRETCSLIMRFGDWGSVLVTPEGEILDNGDYAEACRVLRLPARVYHLPADKVAAGRAALAAPYGVYDFSRVEQAPISVSYAQPSRLRKDGHGTRNRANISSCLYAITVEPSLAPETRLLDFGAGQADHARDLFDRGYAVCWYEPYQRVGQSSVLDVKAIATRISILTQRLDAGLFDVTVCDHVLNSVLSWDFQPIVVGTVGLFTANEGAAHFAWRMDPDRDEALKGSKISPMYKESGKIHDTLYLYDEQRVSGSKMFVKVHRGHFRRQFMASEERFRELLAPVFEEFTIIDQLGVTGVKAGALQATCRRPRPVSEAQARAWLAAEFDLEYPGGIRLNLHEPLIDKVIARLREAGRLL
jgi:ParB family transcriptional regulator, chromosome partitioning protein